ncbi:MAG: response regulator [Holophagales bacterium]|nr:response regulator [Holophagales bacterium]
MSTEARHVLVVDDNELHREALVGFLRSHGYGVTPAASAKQALAVMDEGPKGPTYVLLDLVLGGDRRGGAELCEEVRARRSDAYVVIYTADPGISDEELFKTYEAGAHKILPKLNAEELLRDLAIFVEDMADLEGLRREIASVSEGNVRMISALVGLGAAVRIVDRQHRVWFSSEPRGAGPAESERREWPCWNTLFGRTVEWGPCPNCHICEATEANAGQSRLVIVEDGGGLKWVRSDSIPVFGLDTSGPRRVIGVRETAHPIGRELERYDRRECLRALAEALVRKGFRRVRLYESKNGRSISCVCVATDLPRDADRSYRQAVEGTFETSEARNRYMKRALEAKRPQLYSSWDPELLQDADAAGPLALKPPWIDYPIWSGAELAGWIGLDFVREREQTLAANFEADLRPYSDELVRVFRTVSESAEGGRVLLRALAEAETLMLRADTVRAALRSVLERLQAAISEIAPCFEVRVRVRDGDGLRLLARVGTEEAEGAMSIPESDPESLAAHVVRTLRPVFLASTALHREEPRAETLLPPGRHRGRDSALAILPLEVVGVCVGTLSIQTAPRVTWANGGEREGLAEFAKQIAVLVHDIARDKELEEARATTERDLQRAIGAIHGVRGPARVILDYVAVLELDREGLSAGMVDRAAVTEGIRTAAIGVLQLAERLRRLNEPARASTPETDLWFHIGAICARRGGKRGGPECRLSLPAGSACVRLEPQDLELILQELMENAAKAEATVVSVGGLVPDDGSAVFFVEDDGEGIPDGEQEKIFESWYFNFPGGTGLGLAVVERIVTQAGGAARAVRLKKGLRIEITLPVILLAAGADAEEEE